MVASKDSRDVWLPLSNKELPLNPEAEAQVAEHIRPVRQLAVAALVVAALAVPALAAAVALKPVGPGGRRPHAAVPQDFVGLDEAKPGSFASKMTALVHGQEDANDLSVGWFTVVRDAILRKEHFLESDHVAVLKRGEHVLVAERKGRRVRIEAPLMGWASVKTTKGDPILQKTNGMGGGAAGSAGGLGALPSGERADAPTLRGAYHDVGVASTGDWTKMSGSQVAQSMKEGTVDPRVVIKDTFGEMQGFLGKTLKQLQKVANETEQERPTSVRNGTMARGSSKETLIPMRLPPLEEVQKSLARRDAFARGARPLLADHAAAAAANQDPHDEKLLGQEALEVAKKLLAAQGQKLKLATKENIRRARSSTSGSYVE